MPRRAFIFIVVGALAPGVAEPALAEEGSAAPQAGPAAAQPAADAVSRTVNGATQAVDAAARPVIEQATRTAAPANEAAPTAAEPAVTQAVTPAARSAETAVTKAISPAAKTAQTVVTQATAPVVKTADAVVTQAVAPAAKSVDSGVRTTVERTRQDAQRALAPIGNAVDESARPLRETAGRVAAEVSQNAAPVTPPASDASSARARTRPVQDAGAPAVARASSRNAAPAVTGLRRTERRQRTGEAAAARTRTDVAARRSPAAVPALADRETGVAPSAAPAAPQNGGSESTTRRDRGETGFTGTQDLGIGGSLAGAAAAGSAGGAGPMFVLLLVGLAFGAAGVMRRLQLVQVDRPGDVFSLLLAQPG